jgi:alkaline phosphatase
MRYHKIVSLLSLLLVITALSCRVYKKDAPKNIILLIADGCGFNHITAASFFQYGQTGKQIYESFPVKFAVSTFSKEADNYDPVKAWKSFDWIMKKSTDSAAAATAISTGYKTKNGSLSVDAQGHILETIAERAEKLKKSSGVVTSVPINDATPAAFCAHDTSRDNYSAIMNDILYNSALEVIMGTGNPMYDDDGRLLNDTLPGYDENRMLWQQFHNGITGADADGDGDKDAWTFVEDETAFHKLTNGETPPRVLGLAKVHSTLRQPVSGNNSEKTYRDSLIQALPTLPEITQAALNILDEDQDGFFLIIEGGAVDWAAHDNQSGRMIEELIDFNQTVQSVVDWVDTHSNWAETLVIVTADHETGYLTGPGSGKNDTTFSDVKRNWTPLVNNGKGIIPGMEWHSHGHTNSLVPFYARGCGSEKFQHYADEFDPVRGMYLDNTEIGKVMFELWTLKK